MTLIEYAEREAEKHYDAHLEDFTCLKMESNATFAFIAAAASGTLGYAINLATSETFATVQWTWLSGAIVLLGHLLATGWILSLRCMMTGAIVHKGNKASNLLTDKWKKRGMAALMEGSILNLEDATKALAERNSAMGITLNNVRKSILLAPLTFVVAAGLGWLVVFWANCSAQSWR